MKIRYRSWVKNKNNSSLASTHSTFYSNTNKSMKLSKNQLNIIQRQSIDIQPPSQIYFVKQKKVAYFKRVINNYFEQNKNIQSIDKSTQDIIQQPKLISISSRKNKTSEINRKSLKSNINMNIIKNQKKQINQDTSNLYIITEQEKAQRPSSEQKHKRYENSLQSKSMAISLIQKPQNQVFTQKKSNKKHSLHVQMTYSNKFYQLLSVRQNNKDPIENLKKYTKKGQQMLKREQKVRRLKVPLLWKFQNGSSLQHSKPLKCIRQELYSLVQQKQGNEDIFLIYPKKSYEQLFLNNNQLLISLITQLCKQFQLVKSKVVHSNIHINSIFRKSQKEIFLAEWGTCGIQEILKIRDNNFKSYMDPIIGGTIDWAVVPEYLSPQYLEDYRTHWQQRLIWKTSTSSHIWSLGCLIYEIITLVPIWIPYRCKVKGKDILSRGILCVKKRTIQQIQEKHRYFRDNFRKKVIQNSVIEFEKINPKILYALEKMLILNPQERAKPSEILQILKF